jgi:hypothetical protein
MPCYYALPDDIIDYISKIVHKMSYQGSLICIKNGKGIRNLSLTGLGFELGCGFGFGLWFRCMCPWCIKIRSGPCNRCTRPIGRIYY